MTRYKVRKQFGQWHIYQSDQNQNWDHLSQKDSWQDAIFAVHFLMGAQRVFAKMKMGSL